MGLAGLDVEDGNSLFLSPFHQFFTDVFRAIINTNSAGLAAPFDDPVQAADDAFGWQREVHLDAQTLAVEIVQHVQEPKCTSVAEAISHEVHRPGHVRRVRHRQRIGLVPFQPFPGLDPQVQLKRALDATDAFVVPRMTLHVAQMQETQAKPPGLAGIGQTDQQIGDLLVLGLQLRAIAIAR